MTNEELAIRIQDGETELYTQLWDNTKYLLFRIMRSKLNGSMIPNHITIDDLRQEMYFALCKAVNYYDREKSFLFSTYLPYQVLNVLRNTIYRDKSLIMEESYNEPLSGDEDLEKLEFIPDAESENLFYNIELSELQITVRQAVSELKERERAAIALKYFHGLTLNDVAVQLNVSLSRAESLVNSGLRSLRRNPDIIQLHHDIRHHAAHNEEEYQLYSDEWEYSLEMIQAELELSNRLSAGEVISYGKQKAFIRIAKSRYISAKMEESAEIKHAICNK